MAMPIGGRCVGRDRAGRRDPAAAEIGQPRIGGGLPSSGSSGAHAPRHEDRKVGRGCDLHLRPQPVERQALGERLRLIGAHIRGVAVRQPVQHEIPQDLSLRRQQRAVAAAVAVDRLHVERHHILQQRRRIRTGDADDGAVVKMGDGHFSLHPLGVARSRRQRPLPRDARPRIVNASWIFRRRHRQESAYSGSMASSPVSAHCTSASAFGQSGVTPPLPLPTRGRGVKRHSPMPQTFDLILRRGSVVNHDGIGAARHRRRGGRIAALGDLSAADAGEIIDATGLTILPGVIDTPGAFPRARRGAQGGPGDRLARRGDGRRHRGVRDAEHRPAHRHAPRRSPTSSRARAAACIATTPSGSAARRRISTTSRSWSACPARPASRCSWAPRPATCSSPTMRACARILRTHAAARRLPRRGRVPPDASGSASAVPGDPSSHPVWRDAEAALSATRRLVGDRARDRRARSTCCTSRRRRRCASSPTTRTSPRSR